MYANPEHKIASPDRVFVLEPIDGKIPKAVGSIDSSLFQEDGNKLHAVMDTETCLWSFRYERGAVPQSFLGQRFTSFKNARKFAEDYFARRNIKVSEVKHKY